ncbi:hypothetical protein HNY73_001764 [Argiope bruennichi]|uniref:Uncharacterized protein n=1 Tax=Argiope bruennichi TaxID=94029 RepID=A0A8T0FVN6_ARGBR|nr:hypothetical protein HNY73_001764 [Argiope bruennichi]
MKDGLIMNQIGQILKRISTDFEAIRKKRFDKKSLVKFKKLVSDSSKLLYWPLDALTELSFLFLIYITK